MRIYSVLTVLICWLAVGGAAAADDKTAARDAYHEGMRQYDLGEYQLALDAFKRAYLNFEDSAFLFNIAQCHRQLGNKVEAIKFYRTYVRKLTTASNRAEVENMIGALEAAVEQERKLKSIPPQGTVENKTLPPPSPAPAMAPGPVEPTPQQPVIASTTRPSSKERKPVYKRWWPWTLLGVVVAGAAVGVTLGVILSKPPAFNPTLHEIGPAASALTVRY